ncbi:glycine zipper 2TM domain-containing protein [uncultured Pseudodesulfovibrio sp.]|uniref:glycine zipper 2TM domain-containing protein n=1 Tax=uncultured Pseudodesulfovibrio sp. TaxID=2035858 RepID=UPI0029C6B6B6|nr:glycine zipper domain-containing protein [uncultured Pseudodesulfovibrio sp.]
MPTHKRFAVRTCIFLLIFSMLLAGCQATKKETGTAVGAVLGGTVGLFFGKGAGKAIAIGIGALAGGFIGNQIGGYLDEQDRLAVERESAKALSQSKDGETVKWENPDTKAKAEIKIEKTETIEREVPIVRRKEVEKPGKLTLIGEAYEILTDSNVRLGPSMDYDVAKVLKKGSVVLAVGQVKGKNWILVNQNRQAIGYIHASLIGKEGTLEKQKVAAKEPAVMTPAHDLDALSEDLQTAKAVRPAVDLDEMVASYPDDETTEDLIAERVEVEAPARTVTMKVSTPKGEEEKTVVASKGTDGAWEIL